MSRPRIIANEKGAASTARRADPPLTLESGQDRKLFSPDVVDPQRNQNQMLLVRRYGRACWVLIAIFAMQGFLSIVHLNTNKKDLSGIHRRYSRIVLLFAYNNTIDVSRWDYGSRNVSNALTSNATILKASEGADDLTRNNPEARNPNDFVGSIFSSSLGLDERSMDLFELLKIRRAESLNSSLRNEAAIDPSAFSSEPNISADKMEEIPRGRKIPLADIELVPFNSSMSALDQVKSIAEHSRLARDHCPS
jgi:hypothetical protein